MVLGWLCAARDVESSPDPDDGSLLNGLAQIHARDAVCIEVTRSEYSYAAHEVHKVRDAWIGHKLLTKRRDISITPDIL
jgi:hypothetical protein